MKLRFPQGDITIGNDSEPAKKILAGFDYEFSDGKITIKPDKNKYDISDFEQKVKDNQETKEQIHDFIKELIKVYKKVKYNIE